jgi:hypothetical protein
MPVAVITQASERFELKSLPGAFVVIKRMTFGQKLMRSEMAMKMTLETGGDKKSKDFAGEMKMMNRRTTLWEFAELIEDHNLTDVDERKLNFKQPTDVDKLAGQIGEEISTLIDSINNFEDELAEGK